MSQLPPPPLPGVVDLRGFPYMPLDVVRLRDSELAMKTNGDEFRCAVLLWCAAWHQVPAASLPDDDALLAGLAGFGRVVKEWKRIRSGALRGFVKCSDGRLYHAVVAQKAIEAWRAQLTQRWRTECARIKKDAQRKKVKPEYPEFDLWITSECPEAIPYLSQGTRANVPEDVAPEAEGQLPDVPGETASNRREGKGRDLESKHRCGDRDIPASPATAKAVTAEPHVNPSDEARVIAECERAKLQNPTTGNAIIARWMRNGATPTQVGKALAIARESVHFPKALEAKYVDPIVERIIEEDRKARSLAELRVQRTQETIAAQRKAGETATEMPEHLRPRRAASA